MLEGRGDLFNALFSLAPGTWPLQYIGNTYIYIYVYIYIYLIML